MGLLISHRAVVKALGKKHIRLGMFEEDTGSWFEVYLTQQKKRFVLEAHHSYYISGRNHFLVVDGEEGTTPGGSRYPYCPTLGAEMYATSPAQIATLKAAWVAHKQGLICLEYAHPSWLNLIKQHCLENENERVY